MFLFRIVLLIFLSHVGIGRKRKARNHEVDYKHKIYFDQHFNDQRHHTDKLSIPHSRETQLYSKASKRHIQVFGRKINGRGSHGSHYARLIIESDTFGRIRIKGAETNYYICMNKEGKVIGKLNGRRRKRCIFKENYRDNGYTEFVFTANQSWYLAFTKKGVPRPGTKTDPDMKSVQFIERPLVSMSLRSRYLRKLKRKKQVLRNTIKSLLHLRKQVYGKSSTTTEKQDGESNIQKDTSFSERTLSRPFSSRYMRKVLRNLKRKEQRRRKTGKVKSL